MPAVRQDAWTQEEDLLLSDIVLRHIREGSTQLRAFEEAGKRMNRTAAACGFRWNSYVRKQYASEIEAAKKERKERKQLAQDSGRAAEEGQQAEVTLFDAIRILQQLAEKSRHENGQLSASRRGTEEWKTKYEALLQKYLEEKEKHEELQKEYSALLSIMEKARQLAEQD
ncbi:RsfA family transcriptional regulator [Heyndrickxia coagulans]|uniref:RsfA family transcriptional regulator n=1 Tax=Heyndrickxia coagulans TaxID=1398 RepID=UPI0028F80938|nr:RsfA family transcriptional regulator [Heyndrickxia coagulans]MDT9755561.1 RsfA family transcriptional regulator [Heyndrickxia coagulans]